MYRKAFSVGLLVLVIEVQMTWVGSFSFCVQSAIPFFADFPYSL